MPAVPNMWESRPCAQFRAGGIALDVNDEKVALAREAGVHQTLISDEIEAAGIKRGH